MKIREEAEKIAQISGYKIGESNYEALVIRILLLVTRAVDEALDRAVYIVANTELYDYGMINKILALKSKHDYTIHEGKGACSSCDYGKHRRLMGEGNEGEK